jgi:hypothetical protein
MHVILIALLFYTASISAQPILKDVPLKELEDNYWACDYASTKAMMGPDSAVSCSYIFEELRSRKFKGNWSAFIRWWNANQDAEYKKQALKK